MRAMVLAAGFGTRLSPLTNLRPKCLMPAGGRTLLGLWFERLAGWGVSRAVVNTHHLAAMVRIRLERGWPSLEVAESHEPAILGTGGGLLAAQTALGKEPFLLVNSDVIATGHLPALLDVLKNHNAVAVLGLIDDVRFNTVALDSNQRVQGFKGDANLPREITWRTYSGLAAIHPRFFKYIPQVEHSSLVQGLRRAIDAGETVLGIELDGFWDDLGTPDRLLLLHRDLSRGALPDIADLVGMGPFWIDEHAKMAPDAQMEGFVLAGQDVRVEKGASVKNSLLLPGVRISAGALVENAILGDGFQLDGRIIGGAHA
jgi:mannose-1-phosphate guanylyltransferase